MNSKLKNVLVTTVIIMLIVMQCLAYPDRTLGSQTGPQSTTLQILNTQPEADSVLYPRNMREKVELQFNEPIQAGVGLVNVSLSSGGIVIPTDKQIHNDKLHITPLQLLEPSKQYSVTVPIDAVISTNSDEMAEEYTFTFTVANQLFAGGQDSGAILPGGKVLVIDEFGAQEVKKDIDGIIDLVDIVKVSASESHVLALKKDGTVWAWGSNSFGTFGDGTTIYPTYPLPVQVKGEGGVGFLTDIISVSAGGMMSLALKSDGSVWSWGWDSSGSLGTGAALNQIQSTPAKVKGSGGIGFLTNVVSIDAGNSFSTALKSDGTVWSWGYNYDGRLGDGTTINRNYPVQVKGIGGAGNLSQIKSIHAFSGYTVAIDIYNKAVSWGTNSSGFLGNGLNVDSSTPVLVKGIDGNGVLDEVIAVADNGGGHALVLRKDGSLWSWGYNEYGQVGDGSFVNRNKPVQVVGPDATSTLSNVTAIAIGVDHSIALTSDSKLWGWGGQVWGQSPGGPYHSYPSPYYLTTVDQPNFIQYGYNYDSSNRLTYIIFKRNGIDYRRDYIYDDNGNLLSTNTYVQ